jgi:heme exporter protein CcmD
MFPDLGDHAGFIWASYAAVFGVLAAMAVWLIVDGRGLERQLRDIDRRRDGGRR